MKHIVYVAGMLYQHIPPDASITFEAGMLAPVVGEVSSFPGVSGVRKGIIAEVGPVAIANIGKVSGVTWTTI